MGDLETIAPIFLLMGLVLILGYLVPVVLGRIDDIRTAKTQNKENLKWKCKCGTILINHSCASCDVLNRSGVQLIVLIA
ncbi:MAG: hypothetical protein OEL84_07275 [Nitrosopumilus sp.]|nr:hypothetical protein [Nitrosopumilus sp.]